MTWCILGGVLCCHSCKADLADSNDDDALATSDSETLYAKIVEVLSLCLGSAHIPPPCFREVGQPSILQHLCKLQAAVMALFRLSAYDSVLSEFCACTTYDALRPAPADGSGSCCFHGTLCPFYLKRQSAI